MARYDSIYDFRKVAIHRLRDAFELLEPPSRDVNTSDASSRHLRGSMYLAGYAVECILKAYLIGMHSPLKTLSEVDLKLRKNDPEMPNLLSAQGHSISTILRFTDLEAYQDALQRRQFGQIAGSWNVDMRYDPASPPRTAAVEHVRVASELYNWVASRF